MLRGLRGLLRCTHIFRITADKLKLAILNTRTGFLFANYLIAQFEFVNSRAGNGHSLRDLTPLVDMVPSVGTVRVSSNNSAGSSEADDSDELHGDGER